MYLTDIHFHSQISPDSTARLCDMVDAARAAGLDEICITDHCDLLDGDGNPIPSFDWPAAKEQFRALAPRSDAPILRLGLELGSAEYDPALARRILSDGGEELDFVLGSLHNWLDAYGNMDLCYSDYTDNPALAREAMENALEHSMTLVTRYSDCYDSLAHVIYPLRYSLRDGQAIPFSFFEEPVRALFTEVARSEHALEVNTYRGRTVQDWIPVLRWFRECGGRYVTVGSDAHAPGDMGAGVPEATALIAAAGFDAVTTYHRRQPVLHKL